MVEYALMLALIAVVCVGAVQLLAELQTPHSEPQTPHWGS